MRLLWVLTLALVLCSQGLTQAAVSGADFDSYWDGMSSVTVPTGSGDLELPKQYGGSDGSLSDYGFAADGYEFYVSRGSDYAYITYAYFDSATSDYGYASWTAYLPEWDGTWPGASADRYDPNGYLPEDAVPSFSPSGVSVPEPGALSAVASVFFLGSRALFLSRRRA